jgi:hypothetical protein
VDTGACVNGQRAADGQSWLFAVGTLQVGAVLDIAIVPGLEPTTKAQTPFAISFAAPANDAVATSGGTSPTNPPPSAPSATPDADLSNVVASPPIATGLPADKVAQTAAAPTGQTTTRPRTDLAPFTPATSTRDRRVGYLLGMVAVGVAAYALWHDKLMASTPASDVAGEAELRGLGRFKRARHEEPPALT